MKRKTATERLENFQNSDMLQLMRQTSLLGLLPHEPSEIIKELLQFTGTPNLTCMPKATTNWCKDCGHIPLCTKARAQFGIMSCLRVWHHALVDQSFGAFLKLTKCQNPEVDWGDLHQGFVSLKF